jgi:hypothetical protein
MMKRRLTANICGIALAALMALSGTLQAAPAWVWLDDAGRQVFSDMPPPASVPNHRIIRQPAPAPATGTRNLVNPAAESGGVEAPRPATTPPAAAAPGGNVVIVENDEQMRAVERQNAQIRADNCRRAQEALATLQRPGRLATINESGQRVNMTDGMRRTEVERAQQIIRDNCTP